MDTGLNGRLILIAGASGGIGAATVRLLVMERAGVIDKVIEIKARCW